MPTFDARGGRLDGFFHPGNTLSITLTFPSALTGRTFTAGAGAAENPQPRVTYPVTPTVAVNGATVTISFTEAQTTTLVTDSKWWHLVETTGALTTELVVGKLTPNQNGTGHATVTGQVIVAGDTITVSVVGADLAALYAYVDAAFTALKGGVGAGGDTLAELDARIALVEVLGSLATDAELAAQLATILGGVTSDADTLAELRAFADLRLLKSANLSDLGNTTTARSNLGLGSVDNTADTAKPVSTAQQTALNLKANLASPTFTGVPAAPTATSGTNTTQVATTAFVGAEILANGASGRELASAESTVRQTLISTATALTGLSITFTVGSRPVWVEVDLPWMAVTLAGTVFAVEICDTTSGSGGWKQLAAYTCARDGQQMVGHAVERISAAGTYTRQVRLERTGGTGTIANNFDVAYVVSSIRAIEH
jgi:hypothetical protein